MTPDHKQEVFNSTMQRVMQTLAKSGVGVKYNKDKPDHVHALQVLIESEILYDYIQQFCKTSGVTSLIAFVAILKSLKDSKASVESIEGFVLPPSMEMLFESADHVLKVITGRLVLTMKEE